MDAINETRLRSGSAVRGWSRRPRGSMATGPWSPRRAPARRGWTLRITASGVTARCSCRGEHRRTLFLKNRSANRPSHESAIPSFDKAVALCRRAGFTDVLLRGDTDFALTTAFDRWTTAAGASSSATTPRPRWYGGGRAPPGPVRGPGPAHRADPRDGAPPAPRQRQDRIVTDRGFKKITTVSEALVDFDYQRPRARALPGRGAQEKSVRRTGGAGALRRHPVLFLDHERPRPLVHEVVHEARQRCDQENLIAQLKGGGRALHAPVNTLHANWAYMVMAALAWSLKAWVALELPIAPRWRSRTRRSSDSCCEWTSAPSSARSSMALPNRHERATRDLPAARPGPRGNTSFSASLTPHRVAATSGQNGVTSGTDTR